MSMCITIDKGHSQNIILSSLLFYCIEKRFFYYGQVLNLDFSKTNQRPQRIQTVSQLKIGLIRISAILVNIYLFLYDNVSFYKLMDITVQQTSQQKSQDTKKQGTIYASCTIPNLKKDHGQSVRVALILHFLNLNNQQFSKQKPKILMNQENPQCSSLIFHKVRFSIKKRVNYGQGIFVCGSVAELGLWDPSKSYRLKWNQGDVWTGCLLIDINAPDALEYKYIITDWRYPSTINNQWQVGTHNRQLSLGKPNTVNLCDDRWNMDKITLTLFVANGKNTPDSNYYVIGDILELGNWQQKKQMKKINKKGLSLNQKQNFSSFGSQGSEQQFYIYTFYTYRSKQQFFYFYIKKSTKIESQRKPGRVFKFHEQQAPQQHRFKVAHSRGEIVIIDEFSINQLVLSQITPQIYVGSYPKSVADIQKLKENNISAIFSIQSQNDFNKHGLSPHYIKLICQENQIKYKKYSILDMNNEDFVCKAGGGLKMMRQLLKDGQNVYVHCTAGIYRSPQMIALYLSHFQDYSIEQAVNKVRKSHPFAKPNCKVIKDASKEIESLHSLSHILI